MERVITFVGTTRGGVCLGQMDWGEEKMLESPLSFGLGTIYTVLLCGRINLTTKAWV